MKYKLIIDKNVDEEIIVKVHAPSELTRKIEELICSYSDEGGLIGYKEGEKIRLAFGDIECVTVIDRRVIAIDIKGNRYTLRDRLRDLEDIFPPYFIRINKSTLANEHRIARFEAVFSGGVDAVFRCGYREYVSRRCFAEIKRRFNRV